VQSALPLTAHPASAVAHPEDGCTRHDQHRVTHGPNHDHPHRVNFCSDSPIGTTSAGAKTP